MNDKSSYVYGMASQALIAASLSTLGLIDLCAGQQFIAALLLFASARYIEYREAQRWQRV